MVYLTYKCDLKVKIVKLRKARGKNFKVRKIVTVGDGVGVTFPLFWVENIEWLNKNQRVALKLNPNNTITISPIKTVSRKVSRGETKNE